MKQALLDSLIGLPLTEAKKRVIADGHGFDTHEYGVGVILIARPNLVQLWLDQDGVTVGNATAGDPTELDTWA